MIARQQELIARVTVPVAGDAGGRWWSTARELDRPGLGMELRFTTTAELARFDAAAVRERLAAAAVAVDALGLPPVTGATFDLAAPERALEAMEPALAAAAALDCRFLSLSIAGDLNDLARYHLGRTLAETWAQRLRAARRVLLLVPAADAGAGELEALTQLVELGGGGAGGPVRLGLDLASLSLSHDEAMDTIDYLGGLGLLGGLYLSNRQRDGSGGGEPIFPLKAPELVYRMGEVLDCAIHWRRHILVALAYQHRHQHLATRHAAKLLERLNQR